MSIYFDHRQLADEMGIAFFNDQIGSGLPVWLPNGVAIRDELESFVRRLERNAGYLRVVSPHIARGDLYQKSGHLSSFRENMFPPLKWPEEEGEYFLKPMNCPHHHLVFSSSPRSYRQLPLRIAEYGQVYRYEPSGSLKGLSRVRGLCQNDAHIYVDPQSAFDEVVGVLKLHEKCYDLLGLKGYRYRLSKHDSKNLEGLQGERSVWLEAEAILRDVLVHLRLPFFEAEGEAAFYGPKIDVQMAIGNGGEESIASVQLDFLSGNRFDLSFISKSGKSEVPWIIHRAPLGSHERFVALLLEYYQGQLPGWLSPVQVYIIPVLKDSIAAAKEIEYELLCAGIRAQVDENVGSLSKRVLFAHRFRPFSKMILGPNEISSGIFKLRFRDREIKIDRKKLVSSIQQFYCGPDVLK